MNRTGMAIVVGTFFCLSAAAQSQTSAQAGAQSSSQTSVQAQASGGASASTAASAQNDHASGSVASGTAFNAALSSPVDSKKCKPGDAALAFEFSKKLFEAGVFAPAVGYPIVAEGKARLRTIVSAAHKREQLLRAADILAAVAKPLGIV